MKEDQRDFLNRMKNMQKLRNQARNITENISRKDGIKAIQERSHEKEHQDRIAFLNKMNDMRNLLDLAQELRK